jgi:uncharacterized repeat protein (TIGR01451 family)
MKTRSTRHPKLSASHRHLLLVIGVFIVLITLATMPLLSAASSSNQSSAVLQGGRDLGSIGQGSRTDSLQPPYGFLADSRRIGLPGFSPSIVETIATFAADCETPKTNFYLGETVCAKADGVEATDRFINWLSPDAQIFASGPTITPPSGTTTIVLPTSSSNVGAWKATIADPSDSSITPFEFTVGEVPVIATYGHDGTSCTSIPKTDFVLGETVCVKVNGVPVNTTFPNKISWVDTAGFIEQRTDLSADPQSDEFDLPASDTSTVNGTTVDNRGTWRVHVTRNNGRLLHTALFKVSDAANAAAHLEVRKFVAGGVTNIDAGDNVSYIVTLANKGPDAAATVNLTDPTPPNMTFVSFTQTSGSALACVDADCTIASLPAGASAEFLATYSVNSGTSGGTIISNTAVVTSPTSDPDGTQRSATSEITVVNVGNQATCALECPGNITVTANTTQGQDSGAVVTFGSAEPSGDCGAITASPISGSFFAVGTHTVSVTSALGGGSCSFLVTVVADNPPTITCPLPNITEDAGAGNTETNVSVSPPAATGTNVSVSGLRSDAQLIGEPPSASPDLNDPYPVGTTIITWRATEFIEGQPGRSASCTQKIIVTAPDAPTISCPSDKSFNQAGCDPLTLTAAQIGTPATSGNGITVAATRGDSLDLTSDPYPVGITIITWTATDNLGRVASCTQRITVVATGDTEDPVIAAPPNVTVDTNACGMIIGESALGSPNASDNCGTVNISRAGVPPGNFFPTGTTTVTYIATDGAGRTATATQTVTVNENPGIPPTVTAPADITFNTGPGATSCGFNVPNLDTMLGTAAANDNCPGVVVTRTGVPAGNVFPLGNTTITYTATDRNGRTDSDTQVVTVVDNTIPIITAPADVTLYTGPGAASCGVTATNLDAALGTATTSDNCPGAVTVARGGVPVGSVFPLGETIVSYTATDANGNSSAAVTQKVTVVDNTAPVISCPANVTVNLPLNSTATSTTVTYPAATATDNCPGSIGITYSQDSGTVFPVGPTTVTATATDAHGNTSTCTFTVTVLYNFTGFFSPVDNLPTFNEMKAGQAVPLKFSLSGNKGLGIFAADSPNSVQISCNSGDPIANVEETLTAGSSSLAYDASSDRYHYVWKTESAWKNTCRQLNVVLNDGSTHPAKFKFK